MKKLILILSLFISYAFAGDPVIFVHGLVTNEKPYSENKELKELFLQNEISLYFATREFGLLLEERADQLKAEIERLVPQGQFHLVGHSAGGIDSRYVVWKYPELAKRVISITTLATPHHGSPHADDAISDDSSIFYKLLLAMVTYGEQLAWELSTEGMKVFNEKVKDNPEISYFSMAFYIEQPFILKTRPYIWGRHLILLKKGYAKNDGAVHTKSMHWGKSLGTLPGDHFAQTVPIVYDGKYIWKDIFTKVISNLKEVKK